MEKKDGLLQGRDEICEYLGISRPTFENFIEWGLPARYEQGRWYAHTETLNTWLQRWTNVCSSKFSKKDEFTE